MARVFMEVCKTVWSCIPEDVKTDDLERQFERIKINAGFRPPEMMSESWGELTWFGNDLVDSKQKTEEWKSWQVEMYSALSGVPAIAIAKEVGLTNFKPDKWIDVELTTPQK